MSARLRAVFGAGHRAEVARGTEGFDPGGEVGEELGGLVEARAEVLLDLGDAISSPGSVVLVPIPGGTVGAEAGTSQDENNLVQALRRGASNSVSQTGQQIVQRQLNIQPTLTIRPGFPVRVIVTRDLVLAPYGQGVAAR